MLNLMTMLDILILQIKSETLSKNEPTVEPTFKPIAEVKFDEEQLQELVNKAKAEVLASVEIPKGEWIHTKYYSWACSKCAKNPTVGMGYVQNHKELFDFCPNCGADMRV